MNINKWSVLSLIAICLTSVANSQEYPPIEFFDDLTGIDANNDAQFNTEEVPVNGPGGATQITVSVGTDQIAVFQGDIEVGDISQLLNNPSGVPFGVSVANKNALWPNATMRYYIEDSMPYKTDVMRAISAWERTGVVSFQRINSRNGDFVEFVASNGKCRSAVGRVGGQQFIRVSSGCNPPRIAHEIAHAFGLMHEQVRSDRDRYVFYYSNNVIDGYEHNFETNDRLYDDIGPYCYNSLMHYEDDAFAKFGTKTLAINPAGFQLPHEGNAIGQRSQISSCDIRSMAKLYD